jgi:hypothetical protein
LQTRPADEQFSLLKDWTLPAKQRRSLRFVSANLPAPQIPASFLTSDQRAFGERPGAGLVSSFSLLVQAAKKAGKLDELQTAVDQAVAEKLPLADGLATLVAIARHDSSGAQRLKRSIEDSQLRVQSPLELQTPDFMNARWLDFQILEAAIAIPSYSDAARVWGTTILKEHRNTQEFEPLTLIPWIFAQSDVQGLSPAERDAVMLPNLRLWHPSKSSQTTSNRNPPDLWTAIDGEVTQISGTTLNQLLFKYPLTGTFEFSLESNTNSFSDLELGYGGFVPALPLWHELVQIPSNQWTRHSMRASPDFIRFYSDGTLMHTELSPGRATPWLHLSARDQHRTMFRNLQLTGAPMVPREINLFSGDRLDGWSSVQGERISLEGFGVGPRRREMEPRSTDPLSEQAAGWGIKDGVLTGDALFAARKLTPVHLQYFRPMLNGDTLRYEFFYQPETMVIHPAFGSLAMLLKPDGVRLHWLDSTLPESRLLELDHQIDAKDNRRGPDALPLKPAEWNAMQVSIEEDTVRLILNGNLVFERPLESSNSRQFGLFYDRQSTDAKVRNVILSGKWPEKLTAEELADVLAPDNADESPALKQARRAMIREDEIARNKNRENERPK